MMKLRSLASALIAVCTLFCGAARAQAPISPSQMLAEINSQLPTTGTQQIAAATMRGVLGDMVGNFGQISIDKRFNPWNLCLWGNNVNCSIIGTVNTVTGDVLLKSVVSAPWVYLDTFGGDPTCATNPSCTASDAALVAAYSFINTTMPAGGVIVASAGKYKFNSKVTLSLASVRQNISFVGQGQDSTTFYWPNAGGGLKVTYNSCYNSTNFRDLTFSTGVGAGGEGVGLYNGYGVTGCSVGNQAFGASTFQRVTFRGDDGLSTNQYWTAGAAVHAASFVNWDNCNFFGGKPAGVAAGKGISLEGIPGSSLYGILYNISNSIFLQHDVALYYGDFVQGVTLSKSNFSYGRSAIETVASAVGTLSELNLVGGNQFAFYTGTLINLQSPMFAYNATGNIFTGAAGQVILNMPHTTPFVSNGNQYSATGSADGSVGMSFGDSPVIGGTITADSFTALQTAIRFSGTTGYVTVSKSTFRSNGTDVAKNGAIGVIIDQDNIWSDLQNVGGEYVGSHGDNISIGPGSAANGTGSKALDLWGRNNSGTLDRFFVASDKDANGVLTPGAGGTTSITDNAGNAVLQVVAAKIFAKKPVNFAGSSSGNSDLQASATASGVLTLPAATDTLVGKATTDTFTNKTYDTAGAGNSFSINGLAATANTGTGAVARATSPAFTTPNLGTPSAVTLTNGTGLPTTGLTGTLQAAQEPAHTGDVTNSAGSLALAIAANAVTNAKAAQMAANTIKGNNTGGTANAADLTVPQVAAMFSNPQTCFIISTAAATCNNGGSAANNGTYTTPANAKYLIVKMVGGGGAGAGSGTGAGTGGNGGNTTFSTATAGAGTGGTAGGGGAAGGAATSCDTAIQGGTAGSASGSATGYGGVGGASPFGGVGPITSIGGGTGGSATANTGSGGSGAGDAGTPNAGAGGSAGGYCEKLITSPAATLSYAIGAGGTAGTAGTSGFAGGAGGSGNISVTAYFQ